MIFKETWQQVLDGTKTQTRRLVQHGDYYIEAFQRVNNKTLWRRAHCRFAVDHTYAVQPGRGKKAVGRIQITNIRRERLQEINLWDLEHEGVGGFLEEIFDKFAVLWDSLHRKPYRWRDNPEVWVLEFEVLKEATMALPKPRCPYDGMMMQLLNPSKREFDEKWVCPKCGYTGDRFQVREERQRCTETKRAT